MRPSYQAWERTAGRGDHQQQPSSRAGARAASPQAEEYSNTAGMPCLRKRGVMEGVSHMVWGVGIVFVLVVVNAFFVAAEYALVRVRRTRMEAMAAQGSGLAKVVLHGLNHIDQYIAGVQVGITLAGLASGRFGEPVLAAIFDPLFARILPPSLIGAEASTALAT